MTEKPDLDRKIDADEFEQNTCRYDWQKFPRKERPDGERLRMCVRPRRKRRKKTGEIQLGF